jgi:hypothetical protein
MFTCSVVVVPNLSAANVGSAEPGSTVQVGFIDGDKAVVILGAY